MPWTSLAEFLKRAEVRYAVVAVLVVGLPLGFVRLAGLFQDDPAFCRGVFDDLAQGRRSVERKIAWEQFEVLGVDVGGVYSQFASERDRAKYRRLFIKNFSEQFKKNGGRVAAFGPWRVEGERSGRRLIEGSLPHSTITMAFIIIPASGRRQVEWIGWRVPGDAWPDAATHPADNRCEGCHAGGASG